ncbi:MAG TPA: hypothetical protein VK934_01315 [Fimbriimonas sp.]|nr:hypothetical protein [Fimbriimonas sp.]
MLDLLAQAAAPDLNFWNGENGSAGLWTKIALAFLVGIAMIFAFMAAPPRLRRPIVAFFTFISGLFYVLIYVWPQPVGREPGQLPLNGVESVGFWLSDAFPVVAKLANVTAGFLLGLGIFSLLRVHGRRLFKMQKDWFFSLVLIISILAMVIVGYWDWYTRLGENAPKLQDPANWTNINYARDFFFDGMLQAMDAAMFSLIAFYILSAAYRAFRVRSIEATVLLATALLVILSLMGAVEFLWGAGVANVAGYQEQVGPDGVTRTAAEMMAANNSFAQNFTLTAIRGWIQSTVQTPSIRAIDWGIGIGALAMGLRLWLSLERTGGNA